MNFKKNLSGFLLCSISCFAMEDGRELIVASKKTFTSRHLIDGQEAIQAEGNAIDPQNISKLLVRLDHGEKIHEKEFNEVIFYTIEHGLSLPNLDDQITYVIESLYSILFDENEEARFTDISSPYFLSLVTLMSSCVENNKIHPLLRFKMACTLVCAYSQILPIRNLPINDPHNQEAVKWLCYIMDRYEELGVHDPYLYLYCCEDAKEIYEKHAKKAFPDIPLDINNPYIQQAISSFEKGIFALKNATYIPFYDGSNHLSDFALMHEHYLPKNATLKDKCVKDTIQAFEEWAEFCSNPPYKKMIRYITSSAVINELGLVQTNTSGDPLRQDQDEQDVSSNSMLAWDFDEKRSCERNADKAKASLGWLYYRIPQAEGKEPDYERAAHWFLSCQDKGYNRVKEALELPEIKSRINMN